MVHIKTNITIGLLDQLIFFATVVFAVTSGIVPQVNNYVMTTIVLLLLPHTSRGIYKSKATQDWMFLIYASTVY